MKVAKGQVFFNVKEQTKKNKLFCYVMFSSADMFDYSVFSSMMG